MKKRYTKFRILFSSGSKARVDKFFEKLKDKEGVSIYHRKFNGKDKQRFYVREIVRQGSK